MKENNECINANLSLFDKDPHWKLYFPQDGVYKLPVGGIVYIYLNQIKKIKSDVSMDLDNIAKKSLKENLDNQYWDKCFDDIVCAINNLSKFSASEKNWIYKKYSQLAFFMINDLAWDEWEAVCDDFMDRPDKITASYYNYSFSEKIVFLGNHVLDDSPYASFKIAGLEYLYILDFWELLFNPHEKTRTLQCSCCGMFFYAGTNNQRKYCPDCKDNKYSKIKYINHKKDETKKYAKKIGDILSRRKRMMTESRYEYPSDEYNEFVLENQYYKDIIKGKDVERKPEYKNIQTKEEYLTWLKNKHASLIRKRGRKKNEKKNEKG